MEREVVVTMVPTRSETRLLVTVGRDEVRGQARPGRADAPAGRPTLLEAIALCTSTESTLSFSWVPMPPGRTSAWPMASATGAETVHYEVAWVDPRAPRGRRVRGLGDFRDVRRQLRLVWSR